MSQQKSLFMMPWYPRDFMSSTRGWALVARAAYRELLDAQWDMGELPIGQDELRALAGATESEWAIAWPKIESKFPLNCSGRKNLKLERVRADAEAYATRKSDAGRRGGLASASKRSTVVQRPLNDGSSNRQPKPAQATVKHPSPSPSESLSESKTLGSKRTNFVAPSLDQVQAFMIEKGKPAEAMRFFSYYESNGWRVGRNPMKNWKAAVSQWLTRDFGEVGRAQPLSKFERAMAALGVEGDDRADF